MSEGESLDELMKELRSSVEENMERLISCKRTLNDILSVGQIGQKKRRKEGSWMKIFPKLEFGSIQLML